MWKRLESADTLELGCQKAFENNKSATSSSHRVKLPFLRKCVKAKQFDRTIVIKSHHTKCYDRRFKNLGVEFQALDECLLGKRKL